VKYQEVAEQGRGGAVRDVAMLLRQSGNSHTDERGSLRGTRTADSAALIDELASGELLNPE
jgi:hypothetical protein